MAKECKEIGEYVRKSKILLLDIEGTTTSISFVKDKLFPYAEENVKKFLEDQWENDNVKEAVITLRKQAVEDTEKSVDGVVAIPGEDASKEDQIECIVKNVKWQMSSDRKAGPLKELQGLIWQQGYDNGDIKGHVFDDVSAALEQWHSVDGQKVYIYSSGSVQAQKLLFGQSSAGDLLKYIAGHFDTAVGSKQESDSYKSIAEQIGCNPGDILFLTDILKEAEAARAAGLHAALVSREGNAALPAEADAYPLIRTLAQLTASNKRKTDPQESEQPAKIPKTDTTEDSSAAAETKNITETNNESEKMDVEDCAGEPKDNGSEKKIDNNVEINESTTIIEEVTDIKGVTESTDIEPIITEVTEDKNSKESEIEKMDTGTEETLEAIENDKTECIETKIEIKEGTKLNEVSEKSESAAANEIVDNKSEEHTSIAEETPPITITEIEEIENDKESCIKADVIEDVVPIVEEPVTNEDIAELKNVGDVLERECDEILSKVQDVTNLDSITVKPLLNPIVEESMETENTDTNDIVDRILDTELELDMKQSAEVAKSTEIADGQNENTEKSKSEDTNDISKDLTENKETTTEAAKEAKCENGVEEEESVSNVSNAPEVSKEISVSEKVDDNDSENKSPDSKTETLGEKVAPEPEEEHLNGKATNGETETEQNGDTSVDKELKSRLSAENGKEIVNGSNGDSIDVENGLSDKKTESEVTEIKVKTIATEEPSTELIEQPTEA